MNLLLKNARLLSDEDLKKASLKDVLIQQGKIAAVQPAGALEIAQETTQEINCGGHLLLPALIDLQVFAGGAGASGEDVLSDISRAALAGGVGSVLLMPDERINGQSDAAPSAHFYRASPITETTQNNRARLAEMGLACQKGARAFCDGARPITDSRLMRRAMDYASDMGALLMHQPLDLSLAGDGVINEGIVSARLGLAGIPAAAEIVMVARDIELARLTGVKYHAAQISCVGALDLIRRAKDEGLAITCGVSINHLLLTEEAIGDWRTFCKLIPPLRTEADRRALLEGLVDGAIDVIVSGHNPQSQETKRLPFESAADGAVGLETLLAGAISVHRQDHVALDILIRAMTVNPAKLLNMTPPTLQKGGAANLTLCDLDRKWTLDVTALDALHSQSQNAALDGQTLYGKPLLTLLRGEIAFHARSD